MKLTSGCADKLGHGAHKNAAQEHLDPGAALLHPWHSGLPTSFLGPVQSGNVGSLFKNYMEFQDGEGRTLSQAWALFSVGSCAAVQVTWPQSRCCLHQGCVHRHRKCTEVLLG